MFNKPPWSQLSCALDSKPLFLFTSEVSLLPLFPSQPPGIPSTVTAWALPPSISPGSPYLWLPHLAESFPWSHVTAGPSAGTSDWSDGSPENALMGLACCFSSSCQFLRSLFSSTSVSPEILPLTQGSTIIHSPHLVRVSTVPGTVLGQANKWNHNQNTHVAFEGFLP